MRNGQGIALLIEVDFFEVKLVDRLGVLSEWQPRKRSRHGERYKTGVFGIAETSPFYKRLVHEYLFQIAWLRKLRKAFQTEQLGVCSRQEWTKTGGRNLRHFCQQIDVFRMVCKLVVTNQSPVGLTAGRAKLRFVNLFKCLALVKLNGFIKVLEKLSLRDIEHPELELHARL